MPVEREVWVSGVKAMRQYNGQQSYGDIPRTHHDLYTSQTDANWPSANRAIFMRAQGTGTISNLHPVIGANNTGNMQVGIYDTGATSGRGGKPRTLLASSTLAAAPSANALATLALDVSIEIIPWYHWIAIWCSATTTSVIATTPVSTSISAGMMAIQNSLTTGLPGSATATALGSVCAPVVVGS